MSWKLPLAFTLDSGQSKELEVELELDRWKEKRGLEDGYLYLNEVGTSTVRRIPYVFAMKKPVYPIAEGVEVNQGKGDRQLEISVYLPFGADSAKFSLYDSDSLVYICDLAETKDVKRGVFKQIVTIPKGISSKYYDIVTEVEKDQHKLDLINTINLQFQLK